MVILVLLFCILLFLLGFWFGMRQQHVLKCTNQCHRQTSCSEEEDEQMEELSRSRVGGESRNRLLHNNSSKQASSSRKQNICISNDATDNKRSSGISKHGSIEIEKTNNHGEEEGFLGNDQSVC